MTERRYRFWTAAELKLLREIARDGGTTMEAAEELGRPWHSVRQKASRCGVQFKWRFSDVAARTTLLDLIGKGLSPSRAAVVMGRTPSAGRRMAGLLVRDGLIRRRGPDNHLARWTVIERERGQ